MATGDSTLPSLLSSATDAILNETAVVINSTMTTSAMATRKQYYNYSLNPDPYAVLIGVSYSVIGLICLTIDVVVLVAMFRAGLMRTGRLFVLAAVAIVDGIVRMAAFTFYFGPSIILQHNLGDDTMFGPVAFHVITIMFASFFAGSLTELVIAVDRLLTIKRVVMDSNFAESSGIFTRRNCIIYAVSAFPIWLAIVYFLMLYATPCCKGYFTYEYFSVIFDFPPQPYVNVFFDYIDRPFIFVCVIISVPCYCAIFFILRRAASHITDPTMLARRRKEANNCLQFAYAYIFYVLLWLTFEALPYLPQDKPYWFTIEIYSAFVECTTTAIIQAIMNSKVRAELKQMFGCTSAVHPIMVTGTGTGDSATPAVEA